MTNVYSIANQVSYMYEAGGFAQTGDINGFILMARKARKICIEACRDADHVAVRQIDKVLHLAISMA